MKKIVCLIFMSLAALGIYAERIPYQSVVYLDVSQEWCCKTTYAVCTSSGGDVARIMQPVEGKDGVYTYTVTMHDGMQENFRFGYSEQVVTKDQSGWSGFTTKDHDGKWSAAKPYYIVTGSNGSGYWAAEPSSGGTTTLDSIVVTTPISCIDSTYDVVVSIYFTGMPCSISMTGDQWNEPVKTTRINKPLVIKKKEIKGTAGENHNVSVTLYSSKTYTSEIATLTQSYVSPDIECEAEYELGDMCTDEAVTLSTDAIGDVYRWSTGESGTSIEYTPSIGKQDITVEIYKSVLQPEQNLMANGDFESNPPEGFTSDYHYVGWDKSDYYSSHGGESNLYVITSNANYFWRDFAPIEPHGGSYYALFDAGKDGYAWKATTTDNPELKIQKDSVYLFSYWAAYPNIASNNSPAILQFEIKYQDGNGSMQTQLLGSQYKLGQEEEMNGWYQQTVSWKAPCDADYVEIGVKDLNDASGGNDFCLDDIMFQQASTTNRVLVHSDIFHINGIDCSSVPPVEPECNDNWLRTKWTDMIFVDNSAGDFVRYQWYINGQEIEGATEQYYRAEQNISSSTDLYSVRMWKADGTIVESCEKMFSEINPSHNEYPANAQLQETGRRMYLVGSHFRIVITYYEDGSVKPRKEIY